MTVTGRPIIIGGGGNLQPSKNYTVTSKNNVTIAPDTGYDGMEEVALTIDGASHIVAANIRKDKTILGITGTYDNSDYTLLATAEYTTSTTSTNASSVGTVDVGSSAYDCYKIIYVKIRDKNKRAGYFLGSDTFFINPYDWNAGSTNAIKAVFVHSCTSTPEMSTYVTTGQSGYGVYAYSLNSSGSIAIYKRYNSTNSRTVNGTYTVEVYGLKFPKDDDPWYS